MTFPGRREVSSPLLVSMTTEPSPPPSSAAVLRRPKRAGSGTGSGSTGSGWPSRPGCSADPNTGTTSGTTSGAGPPGTRRRTVERLGGEGVSAVKLYSTMTLFQCVKLWKSTARSLDASPPSVRSSRCYEVWTDALVQLEESRRPFKINSCFD